MNLSIRKIYWAPKAPMAPPIPTKRAVPFKSLLAIVVASYTVCALTLVETSTAKAIIVNFFFILFSFYDNTSLHYLLLLEPPPPPLERVEEPPPPDE